MIRFQDCYKEKYSWFAAYYLICRLVIMMIVYFANSDYSTMIYYVQTSCVIIVITHMIIQPYKNNLLNKMDSIILLIMLLLVNPSAFSFYQSLLSGLIISLVLLPLILAFAFSCQACFKHHVKRWWLHFKANGKNEYALGRYVIAYGVCFIFYSTEMQCIHSWYRWHVTKFWKITACVEYGWLLCKSENYF